MVSLVKVYPAALQQLSVVYSPAAPKGAMTKPTTRCKRNKTKGKRHRGIDYDSLYRLKTALGFSMTQYLLIKDEDIWQPIKNSNAVYSHIWTSVNNQSR
jgi:hypothetical protein